MKEKRILGRKDIVSFPQFDLIDVPVKIDSGAYSSSMHCHTIELIQIDGKDVLEVIFLDPSIEGYTGKKFQFEKYRKKAVKSSNGISEVRFFVFGSVRLFNETVETLFSLTERTGLRNPILLGRRLLNKRFLIDSSRTNCSFRFESQQTTQDNQ